jgi:hypothetical protein
LLTFGARQEDFSLEEQLESLDAGCSFVPLNGVFMPKHAKTTEGYWGFGEATN